MGLEIINKKRKEKNMTTAELAEKSGVPISTIKKICAGITTNPTLDTVKAIAKTLGCKLDDFDDAKKESPSATDNHPITEEQIQKTLIDFFTKMGYIEENGDISDETLHIFMALVDFLDSYFEGRKQK